MIVRGNQVASRIAKRVPAVLIHLVRNGSVVAIRKVAIAESLRTCIKIDGQEVAD